MISSQYLRGRGEAGGCEAIEGEYTSWTYKRTIDLTFYFEGIYDLDVDTEGIISVTGSRIFESEYVIAYNWNGAEISSYAGIKLPGSMRLESIMAALKCKSICGTYYLGIEYNDAIGTDVYVFKQGVKLDTLDPITDSPDIEDIIPDRHQFLDKPMAAMSPCGKYIVIAGYDGAGGDFEYLALYEGGTD